MPDTYPTLRAIPRQNNAFGRSAVTEGPTASPEITDGSLYLTLKDVIALLVSMADVLTRLRPHPLDNLEVLFTAQSVRALIAVAGRIPSTQQRTDSASDASVAESEIAELESSMKPLLALAAQARRGTVKAEQLALAILQTRDPRSTAQRYLASTSDSVDVTSKGMLLTPPADKPLPRTYDADTPHDIVVTVDTTYHASGQVKVLLLSHEPGCPLFRPADLGTRLIMLSVPNNENLISLTLSRLIDGDVKIRASLQIKLTNTGFEYSGSLISVFDEGRILPATLTQMREQYALGL